MATRLKMFDPKRDLTNNDWMIIEQNIREWRDEYEFAIVQGRHRATSKTYNSQEIGYFLGCLLGNAQLLDPTRPGASPEELNLIETTILELDDDERYFMAVQLGFALKVLAPERLTRKFVRQVFAYKRNIPEYSGSSIESISTSYLGLLKVIGCKIIVESHLRKIIADHEKERLHAREGGCLAGSYLLSKTVALVTIDSTLVELDETDWRLFFDLLAYDREHPSNLWCISQYVTDMSIMGAGGIEISETGHARLKQ